MTVNQYKKEYNYTELQNVIGYRFKDVSLLINALMHSSYTNETHRPKSDCNERLEFLGDSVLSIIVSDFIYRDLKRCDEGGLTRLRAAVVCEDACFRMACDIELGEYMYFGHGEKLTHANKRKSILADAFEALLAAIYLDGGVLAAREFLMPRITPLIDECSDGRNEDYKSLLQRIVQETPEEELTYELVREDGPPHDRIFTMRVMLNSNQLGVGKGRSKREAEQNAAGMALITLGVISDEKATS